MNALGKILAGAQTGVEFALSPGRYVLGCGDGADLVLVDAAVRPRHAALTIADDAWTAEPLDGAELWVDGRPATGPTALAPFAVLSLGGVHLALGPDESWPSLPPLPSLSRNEPAPPPPVASNNAAEDVLPGSERDAVDSDVSPSVAPEVREKSGGVRRSSFAALLFLAAILAALLWGGYALYNEYWSPLSGQALNNALRAEGVPTVYPAPKNALDLPAGTIGLMVDGTGAVTLSGLVRDDGERLGLLASPALAGRPVKDGLTTMKENVLSAAARVRADFLGVELEQAESGHTAVLGGSAGSQPEALGAFRLARELLDRRIGIRRSVRIRGEDEAPRIAAAPEEPGSAAAQEWTPSLPPMEPAQQGWKIAELAPTGFIDQDGRLHEKGEYLSSALRLIDVWPNGVVFQRGDETLFRGMGTTIYGE